MEMMSSVINFFKTKMSLNEKLARLATLSGLSFRQICHEDVKDLLLQSYRTAPSSPTTVSTQIHKFFEEVISHYTALIQNFRLKNKFTLIFDEWTSISNRRYLNITLALDEEIQLNLGLAPISDKATSENCLNLVQLQLLNYDVDLKKDVVAIVTDGAAVMKKIGRLVDPVHQQLCFAHGIHLAVTKTLYQPVDDNDDNLSVISDAFSFFDNDETNGLEIEIEEENHLNLLQNYQNIVQRVRFQVSYFKSSRRNEQLKAIANELIGKPLCLISDCKTRWSSLYLMLERFKIMYHCVDEYYKANLLDFDMTEDDFVIITDLVRALSPVKSAVTTICKKNSTLYEADLVTIVLFEKLNKQESLVARSLSRNLKIEIAKRRTILSDCLFFLETKNVSLEVHTLLGTNLPQRAAIQAKLSEMIKKTDEANNSQNSSLVTLDDHSFDEDSEADFFMQVRKRMKRPVNEVQNANDAIQVIIDELETFENTGAFGKNLKFLYQTLKSVKPTSVDSERAFSTASKFCTKLRNRLSDDLLNDLLVVKDYLLHNKKHCN